MNLRTININSETDQLRCVLLHRPGKEVENMVPATTARSLYSDILNLSIVNNEYYRFESVLKKIINVLYVKDLLIEICKDTNLKQQLIVKICSSENLNELIPYLLLLEPEDLANQLISGVVMKKNTLTRFLDDSKFILNPLPNFFFIRDAAFVIDNKIIISKMANMVRVRESIIVEAIFKFLGFNDNLSNISTAGFSLNSTIEGGDIIVLNKETVLIGMGSRTNSQGIDYLIEILKKEKIHKNIIVQELPKTPESFIHLDMVFTMLDQEQCMVYSPIVLKSTKLQTILIKIKNGEVTKIESKENLLKAINETGNRLNPIICGGNDNWDQEREQWHSGTNFFAVSPGKIIGYARNTHTIDALSKAGYRIIDAESFINLKEDLQEQEKFVITIPGSELARGGGGARCMTLPVFRKN